MANTTTTPAASRTAYHHVDCPQLNNDEYIPHTAIAPIWSLDPTTHATSPPLPLRANFCACLWSHLPTGPVEHVPGPHVYGPIPPPGFPNAHPAPRLITLWTPRADTALALLWFHTNLHTGIGTNWTRNYYHEALSVYLGYRVSQHDFFTRMRNMRSTLPKIYVDTAQLRARDPVIVAFFGELNGKWQEFMRNFDLWEGYEGILVEEEELGPDRELGEKVFKPQISGEKLGVLARDVVRKFEVAGLEGTLPQYVDEYVSWWYKLRHE